MPRTVGLLRPKLLRGINADWAASLPLFSRRHGLESAGVKADASGLPRDGFAFRQAIENSRCPTTPRRGCALGEMIVYGTDHLELTFHSALEVRRARTYEKVSACDDITCRLGQDEMGSEFGLERHDAKMR
jgi:hypothetical protein